MAVNPVQPAAGSERILIGALTPDAEFAEALRTTFGASAQIDVEIVNGRLNEQADKLDYAGASIAIIDLDDANETDVVALQRLMLHAGAWPPVIAVAQSFDASVARTLMQSKIADFLVKPIPPVELVRACARLSKRETANNGAEAKIYSLMPSAGGVGVTTLAIQTAMLLLNSRGSRMRPSTCLVDLDFQHGAIADYLDLEPRLDLAEVEPRPERLDRQLLEVMLSHHSSGLAVVAAPHKPAEMRSFDPDVVTRLLDLVSSNFEYVVFDMPRTWFSWTDSVLLGSNQIFIVSEATVPGLRQAKQLVAAINTRLTDAPKPQVIVNRFTQKMFSTALTLNDLQQVLGESFAAAIPNDYLLVREAIDRGVPLEEVKPGNKVTQQMKKYLASTLPEKSAAKASAVPLLGKLKLSLAR
jgi:pilus assembly protein CpaE